MQAIKAASKIVVRVVVSGFLLLTCAHLLFTQGSSINNRLITASVVTMFLAWGGYAKKSLDLTGEQVPSTSTAGAPVIPAQRPENVTASISQFNLPGPTLSSAYLHWDGVFSSHMQP